MENENECNINNIKSSDIRLKVLVLGDATIGKTSLITRYCTNEYQPVYITTIGIDKRRKNICVNNVQVKLIIWDTAGQEKFRNIAKQYYQGADGVLLVFDVCDRKSFEKIEYWLKELKDNKKIDSLYLVIVGNKIDLEDKRVVAREEGEKYANENNINYFEVSAKTGEGIAEMFNDITKGTIDKIFKENQDNIEDKKQIYAYLDNKNSCKKKKKCCM